VQDDVLLGEPAEEVFEHAQARALRAPAETLAVGFGAAPEGALDFLHRLCGTPTL
jgi:hypothetical protein